MNADAFRELYAYHFAANRKIWNEYILPLAKEKFTESADYSVGSVRNQVVHLMNIDDRWFSGLRGVEVPGFINPVHYGSKEKIRAFWDTVEANMQAYLDQLTDEMLFEQPFPDDKDPLYLWEILFHVLNHGTDHRAQTLSLLHRLGVDTKAQDYVFFIMGML